MRTLVAIIECFKTSYFENEIQELLNDGWILHGNMCVTSSNAVDEIGNVDSDYVRYTQMLTLEVEE